ncbi:hypothetical protein [Escherichia coli]|uniref:hypothetical protein n=2 Tax=Enterobacteriaceae TaxID=543 RepID=UPI0008FBC015
MFMSCVPSKGTPLIFLGVASLFAATAVPSDGRAFAALFTVSRKPRFSGKPGLTLFYSSCDNSGFL